MSVFSGPAPSSTSTTDAPDTLGITAWASLDGPVPDLSDPILGDLTNSNNWAGPEPHSAIHVADLPWAPLHHLGATAMRPLGGPTPPHASNALDETPPNLPLPTTRYITFSTHRKHPCIRCQLAKETCFGLPFCQRCMTSSGLHAPPMRLAESTFFFLNTTIWFEACQSLRRSLRGPERQTLHQCSSLLGQEHCKIILEFDFEDLAIRRDATGAHIVCFDPHNNPNLSSGQNRSGLVQTRVPFIDQAAFDQFVLGTMWRPKCASRRRPRKKARKGRKGMPEPLSTTTSVHEPLPTTTSMHEPLPTTNSMHEPPPTTNSMPEPLSTINSIKMLPEAEQAVFSHVQLLLGYYSLLRNLNLVWTDETTMPAVDGRFILAEFVYYLGYRISHLLSEFSNKILPKLNDIHFENHFQHDGSRSVPHIRPPVFLYAIEFLYWGLKSTGLPEWKLPEISGFGPVKRLQSELRHAYEFFLNHLLAYQCHFSAKHQNNHQLRTRPGLVNLVQSYDTGLPKHLVLSMQRHVPCDSGLSLRFGFNLFPYLHDGYGQRSILDILALRSGGVLLAMLTENWEPRHRFKERWVTEGNSQVSCRWSNVEHDVYSDQGRTATSIGYLHSDTMRGMSLEDHPDPPRWLDSTSSIHGLAHLKLEEGVGNQGPHESCVLGSLDTTVMNLDDLQIPEKWRTEFSATLGQTAPSTAARDMCPSSNEIGFPLHKRRHGGDGSNEQDSDSDSSHPSKRRETFLPYHAHMQTLLINSYGGKSNLPYNKSVREYLKQLKK